LTSPKVPTAIGYSRNIRQEDEPLRAELQAQGEFLQTVLASLSSGVLTLDQNGRMITANSSCLEILSSPY